MTAVHSVSPSATRTGPPDCGGVALGVDIGGTKTRLGLVSEAGEILASARFATKPGRLRSCGIDLIGHIQAFLRRHETLSPAGVGIGVKGYIDAAGQRYSGGTLFTEPESYSLVDEVAAAVGLTTRIDNDLKATASAEARWGVGRERRWFTYVNVGTGTSIGIIEDGRLVRGSGNMAGEVGHYVFAPSAGNDRIHDLESVVSGRGFDLETRRLAPLHPDSPLAVRSARANPITSREVFRAWRDRDPLAQAVVATAVDMLAYALVNIESILNSGCYVFGGGVVSSSARFVALVDGRARDISEAAGVPWTATSTVSALGSDDAGLLGAASVFFESTRRSAPLPQVTGKEP